VFYFLDSLRFDTVRNILSHRSNDVSNLSSNFSIFSGFDNVLVSSLVQLALLPNSGGGGGKLSTSGKMKASSMSNG
jgi:hypothetical protein